MSHAQTIPPEEAQRIHAELLDSIEKIKPFLPVEEPTPEPPPIPATELAVGDSIEGLVIADVQRTAAGVIVRYSGETIRMAVGDYFQSREIRGIEQDGEDAVNVTVWGGRSIFTAEAKIPARLHRKPA